MRKKKNYSKFWVSAVAVFIVLLMAASALNMGSTNEDNDYQYNYNGLLFNKLEGSGWVAYIQDYPIILSNNPKYTENISMPIVTLTDFNTAEKIYITKEPNIVLDTPIYFLKRNIKPLLQPNVFDACTKDSKICSNLPLKSCKDASENIKVIEFSIRNETNINYYDNCLVIQGPESRINLITDKVILTLLGL